MKLLAIDTAANICAACILDAATGDILAAASEDIGRGHAERLMPMIDSVMSKAGLKPTDLDRVAVATGPGSFTGIRVGISVARALALALDIPAVGVTSFQAIAAWHVASGGNGPFTVALRGGRDNIYVQAFDAAGDVTSEPSTLPAGPMHLAGTIVGNAANLVATDASLIALGDAATAPVEFHARRGVVSVDDPKPCYLRGADAKPQSGFALPHIGETA